jgi:sigma-B regulation protein RsbU (phosphoserine phosphatase)
MGNDANMFVTMFACVLDYQNGELSYVNAGHNPPLLEHEGSWEWMRNISGMPLGMFDGLDYDCFTHTLQTGDMLYLYTDGVTEAISADKSFFGEERLVETLERYTGLNARSVSVGVRRAITDFTLDAEQSDDITMLSLRYGVPPEKRAIMVLPADDKQLIHVHNFITEELHRRNAPSSVYNPLDIAAEELFVNVCHYAYPDATPDNPGEVQIGFEYEASPPSLTVTIIDEGIPYNPLAKPDAVTPDDIMEVPIGGLGILMAKNTVDEMTYERVGESNVLSFRKGW